MRRTEGPIVNSRMSRTVLQTPGHLGLARRLKDGMSLSKRNNLDSVPGSFINGRVDHR